MGEPTDPGTAGTDQDGPSPPGMPRWVKVTALVVGILVLVFLVLQLTGIAGQHGPGRHMSGDGAATSGPATVWSSAAVAVG